MIQSTLLKASPLTGDTYYYTFHHNQFYYADTLSSLLKKLPFSPKANMSLMQSFIDDVSIPSAQTMYAEIFKIPPGHILRLEDNTVHIERYWNPYSITTDYSLSFEEAKEKFKKLFKQSIQKQIPPNVKIGCEVSGGFDSSSIYTVAQQNATNIISLTLDMENTHCNEQYYVNEVLKTDQNKHIRIAGDNIDYKNKYDMHYGYKFCEHWPIYDALFMFFPLIEAAKKEGVTHVLTGYMGDQLMMSSSSTVFHYFKHLKWKKFYKEWSYLPNKWVWFYKQIKRELISSLSDKQKALLKKIFLKKNNVTSKAFSKFTTFSSPAQETMITELTSDLHALVLHSSKNTILNEHYGMTVSHPFGDLELVEFMFSVPPEYKYSLGNPRHFHGEALRGILPDSIINRRDKAEFSVIILQQIEAIDRKSLWENPSLVTLNLITQEEIMKHENMYLQKKLKGYALQRYWRMINLEYWYNLNKYIDKGV